MLKVAENGNTSKLYLTWVYVLCSITVPLMNGTFTATQLSLEVNYEMCMIQLYILIFNNVHFLKVDPESSNPSASFLTTHQVVLFCSFKQPGFTVAIVGEDDD